jgi:uncharacterized protein YndB with AHSA1/START domain
MFTAKCEINIKSTAAEVWDALVNPEKIKVYMFGTNTTSEWKVGSRINYSGVWEGKEYNDGGIITKLESEKIFESTYWSSMSGTEDIAENYSTVSYQLNQEEDGILLTVTQDNCKSEESQNHSEQNWTMILKIMKDMLENK